MYSLLTTKIISHVLVRYDSPSSTLDASWLNRAISVKFWNTPCPFTALCGVNARVPISCGVASASKGLAWFVPKRNNWSELIKTVHTEKSGKESSLNSKIIPVCCRCCWPKQQRLVYDISFARSCRVCCSKTRLNGSVFITIFRAHSVWVAQHFFLPTSINYLYKPFNLNQNVAVDFRNVQYIKFYALITLTEIKTAECAAVAQSANNTSAQRVGRSIWCRHHSEY